MLLQFIMKYFMVLKNYSFCIYQVFDSQFLNMQFPNKISVSLSFKYKK